MKTKVCFKIGFSNFVKVFAVGLAFAYTEDVGGITWNYTVDGSSATIEKAAWEAAIPNDTSGSIEIPATLGGKTVTAIGDYAFYCCDKLTSVKIPSDVTSIGKEAFYACAKLTSAKIPSGVTAIGEDAFNGCASLTEAEIPGGVKVLRARAFAGCSSLKIVKFNDGVTSIGENAFQDCKALKEVTFPDTLNNIQGGAFDGCAALVEAVIPDGVVKVFDRAFQNCTSLKRVTIPDSVTSIEGSPFEGCTSLGEVYANGDKKEMLVAAGVAAASIIEVGNVKTWTDTESSIEWSYRIVGDAAEIYKGKFEPVIDSLTAGDVKIPGSIEGHVVTSIGDYAFFGCANITGVEISDGVTRIGRNAFQGCSSLKIITIPSGVTSIGDNAFSYCSGLTRFITPAGVTSIGEKAFMECTSLTDVVIPSSVTEIKTDAFKGTGTPALSVYVDSAPEVFRVGDMLTASGFTGALGYYTTDSEGSPLCTVRFHATPGVSSISYMTVFKGNAIDALPTAMADGYTFKGWLTADGKKVTVGATVVDEENVTYYADWLPDGFGRETDGAGVEWTYRIVDDHAEIYNDDKSAILTSTSGEVSVPSTLGGKPVTVIGDYAFEGCEDLEKVVIPPSVTTIGDGAFDSCTSVKVDVPATVTTIGEGAFWGCDAMKDAAGFVIVHNVLHYYAGSAAEVTVPAGVTRIGYDSFYGKDFVKSVALPDSVKSIGETAFSDCTALLSVNIPSSVTTIEDGAFESCTSLKMEVPDTVTEIGEAAFLGCDAMKDSAGFVIVRNVLHHYAGSDVEVTVPDGVTRVGRSAFKNRYQLKSVTLPDGVTDVGVAAFYGCNALGTVTIPASVTSIKKRAFEYVPLATVYVAKGKTADVRGMLEAIGFDTTGVTFVELCKVVFDANGGTCDAKPRVVEAGKVVGDLPEATFEGYTLKGWFTAKEGGVEVKKDDAVSADVTYYAQWTKIEDSGSSGGGGSGGGDEPVTPAPEPGTPAPESVTPAPEPVKPFYDVINMEDITEPYAAPKAVTLSGAVYDDYGAVGIVELKLGKVNTKKKNSKLSGSVTLLNGKKYTIKAETISVDGKTPAVGFLQVKGLGVLHVAIGGKRFAGSLEARALGDEACHVQTAKVGGKWGGSSATVDVEVDDVSTFPGMVLTDLLPQNEVASVKRGAWTFKKATTVKWAKPKKGAAKSEFFNSDSGKDLIVDTSKGKSNLSGLKLTYTLKKGTFKGSFKLYALQGTGKKMTLKKYTVNVSGVVVEGVGYGAATSKKPFASWPVTVK